MTANEFTDGPTAPNLAVYLLDGRRPLRPRRSASSQAPRIFTAKCAVTAFAAVIALAATGPWHNATTGAAVPSVSPGDRIVVGATACTIGHVYTGADERTYAITAGHCQTGPDRHVRGLPSGATGTFLRAIVDSAGSGGADYGLIDFGRRSMAVPFVGNRPVTSREHPRPCPGQSVCRTGISTGQQCGAVTKTYGAHQYLTTGMPGSVGGDSGGPVWTMTADGSIQIIGIWLGGRITAAGNAYGRFASLAAGIDTLGLD